ncbi:sialate O-acetylesterase [Indioceanicola profundi]|uniref:sialate O-acetylesterase n=1 Tax=Indioceanicola profundi TaxID=2220096 RepID=UPI000E6AD009|nr:sialate O-acetylesterase [Indioceanicola profundi]
MSNSTVGIGPGRTEVEALDLKNYRLESHRDASGGKDVLTYGAGTASGTFTGAAGTYEMTVGYANENDGVAGWKVLVNGTVVESWSGTGGSNSFVGRTFSLKLDAGDVIAVQGVRSGGEYARLDYVDLTAVSPTQEPTSPAPTPRPEPEAPQPQPQAGQRGDIGLGRTEAEEMRLSNYRLEQNRDVSGDQNVVTYGTGTASGTFTGDAGSYSLTVGYANENDGAAGWKILVNGKVVESWSGTGGSNSFVTRSVELDLDPGDVISVQGTRDGGEYARLDYLDVSAAKPGSGGSVPNPPQADTPTPPPSPPPAPAPSGSDIDMFAFVGQSNAAGHFFKRGGDSSGGRLGNDVFEAELAKLLDVGKITAINGASSGSGSNQFADGSNYWWDVVRDKPGPALLNAVSQIKSALGAGRDLDGFIWAQGEDDARLLNGNRSNDAEVVSNFKEATRSVFEYLRKEFGDVPVFIQELGVFPETNAWLNGPTGALSTMRNAQKSLIDQLDYVYHGARTHDAPAHDNIHFNNKGYGMVADRLADSVAEVIGQSSGTSSDWLF